MNMANRHCIDSILQKQDHHVSSTKRTEDSWKEGNHLRRSTMQPALLLSLPPDHPRPFLNDSHRSLSPVWYPGFSRCLCRDCIHDSSSSSWIRNCPTSMLSSEDKLRNGCFSKCTHSLAYERDFKPLAHSSLATKPKQQPSTNSMGMTKRKKRHRTAFTPTQLLGLENAFEQSRYSVGDERKKLGAFLGLTETQIKVWFQNRRTKWKRLRKEAEEEEDFEEDDAERNTEPYVSHESYYPRFNASGLEQRHIYSCPVERKWSLHTWSRDDRIPY